MERFRPSPHATWQLRQAVQRVVSMKNALDIWFTLGRAYNPLTMSGLRMFTGSFSFEKSPQRIKKIPACRMRSHKRTFSPFASPMLADNMVRKSISYRKIPFHIEQ